jgi:hypothetical protein
MDQTLARARELQADPFIRWVRTAYHERDRPAAAGTPQWDRMAGRPGGTRDHSLTRPGSVKARTFAMAKPSAAHGKVPVLCLSRTLRSPDEKPACFSL